ncbi:MAG TPA: Ig-like domain-containing protein, partial [Gemmatimonadales bacterium]|nr:Ig-like domain-containing protein [Gemmatimonadales bacterium]
MNVRTYLRNGARIALLAVVATCTDQRSTTAPHALSPLTPQVLPVIAPTLLTAGNDLNNGATYTTGSISPSPNTLVLVAVMGIRTFGVSPSPTVTGGGMSTWTEVATVEFDSIPFIQRRMTVYRAMSAAPGSGPITISFSNNQSNAQWIVVQWDGVETSGVNGAGAIGQTGSERGDLASGLSVTLAPFANSGNVAFGVFGAASGVHGLPMITPFAGFTELNEQVSQEATPSDFQAEWATSLNTVAALWNSLHGGALAIEIKVATLAVASVTVDPATASVNVGATLPLTATLQDANGDPLTGRVVTWTSSDPAIATVSTAGLVTGVAGGSVTITAESEGQSGTAAVTVTIPVASVTVAPATGSVNVGETLALTATPRDANGDPLTGRAVTWASSDDAVATVTEAGLVTGVGEGAVTITATSEGQSGTAALNVTPPPVATVTVSPATGTVLVGATLPLTATPQDANGNTLTGRVVTWATSNGAIATVTETGVVTGVAAGTVTIAATSEGRVGTASVTVNGGFSNTLLTFGTNPANGRTYTTASIAPAPNALVTVAVLQYSSQGTPPNPTLSGGGMQAWDVVATVIFDPGVGGFPMQRLTIFRAMNATPGSGPITITAPTVALSHAHWSVSQWTGVATSGVNGAGAIRQIGALPGDRVSGLIIPLAPFANPGNVAYGAFGVQMRAAAVTPGVGFIEISEQPSGENTPGDLQTQWATNLPNVSATWPIFNAGGLAIEINTSSTPAPGPAAVASVTVAPDPGSVNVGATLQLTATLQDANGNTLTGRDMTWASSDMSRATVTSTGLVTGVGVGPVTITATSEGQSGTSAVTVALAPVASVTVAPLTANVNVGATVPLTATLTDANGNVLTARTVTWTGSNAFASVSTTGVVTGLAVGSATITATSEGQSGTATVNVTAVPVATVTVTPNPGSVNVGATVPLTAT